MKDYKRKLQFKMLNIVKEIDRVYKLYNIDYYLIYGLESGIVRYKGFIPWNDDFDIGMTYKNYNMFIKVCDKELNKNEFESIRDKFLKHIYGDYIKLSAKEQKENTHYIIDLDHSYEEYFKLRGDVYE